MICTIDDEEKKVKQTRMCCIESTYLCTLQDWCQAIGGNQHRDTHAPKRGGNTLKHDQTMCRCRGREHSKAGVGGEEQSGPTHAPATPAECSDVKCKKKENALSKIWECTH